MADDNDAAARVAPILELLGRLSARRFDEIGELLGEEAVFDVPYADMVAKGRDAFVHMFAVVTADLFDPFQFTVDAIHPSTDGKTVIVEYRTQGRVKSNGNAYANRYVGVFHVVGDRIDLWREYFNPLIFAEATGDVVDTVLEHAGRTTDGES